MAEVFVSRPIPEGPLAELARRFSVEVGPADRPATRDELLRGCRGACALVAMLTDRIDAAFLEVCPSLRVIANFAVGVNNIDLEAAASRGVWATHTPDVLTDATADLTMALLLACARRLRPLEDELRAGTWKGWAPLHGLGISLTGRTLGIVGLGRIGQAVARRARAFGMRLAYAGRSQDLAAERELGARRLPLDELLAASDVVSLHCPLTPETRHLLDARRLARMKPGCILINTARGPVVDEPALAEALRAGHVAAAGLDVFEDEPRVHPSLLEAPNAVLLPHLGSATVEARTAMARLCVEDVIAVIDGRAPRHPANRPIPLGGETVLR